MGGKENPFKFMKGSFRWLEDQMYNEIDTQEEPPKYAIDTIM